MENVEVSDKREIPFCWQDKLILRQIRYYFSKNSDSGLKLPIALAVYLVITELSSEISGLEPIIPKIAAYSGINERQVKKYLDLFSKLNIITIK